MTHTAPLWHSDSGRISCHRHLPAPGTVAWWQARWEQASPEWVEGFTKARGQAPECEACLALAELASLDEEAS